MCILMQRLFLLINAINLLNILNWHLAIILMIFCANLTVLDKEDTNLSQYFDECFDFIDEAKRQGGGVLVHCFVGKSRR